MTSVDWWQLLLQDTAVKEALALREQMLAVDVDLLESWDFDVFFYTRQQLVAHLCMMAVRLGLTQAQVNLCLALVVKCQHAGSSCQHRRVQGCRRAGCASQPGLSAGKSASWKRCAHLCGCTSSAHWSRAIGALLTFRHGCAGSVEGKFASPA